MTNILGVDFELLGFGVPIGEFGDAGLVLYTHQLDDHVEGFAGMGYLAAGEFKFFTELRNHDLGFQ
jgi:hypothetical protein